MNRQLYEGGGISTLQQARNILEAEALPGESLAYINPQEAAMLKYMGGAGIPVNSSGIPSYFLKSVGKAVSGAVKGATKAVKSIVSSDVGKLALMAAGAYYAPALFGGTVGFGPASTYGSFARGLMSPNLIGPMTKAGSLGRTISSALTGGGVGSLFTKGNLISAGVGVAGGLLGSLFGGKEQAVEAFKRNPTAVKSYLAQYYKNTNQDASDEEVNEFVESQTREYAAEGGRIGFAMGNMPMGEPRKNQGGIMELDYRQEGGFVPVGIKEKADDVPAMLSKNEFVFTADAVRGAGNGDIETGAQRLYNTMKTLENGGTV